ncbi:unnamed protein product [Phytomonas sp. EM1]|nr:unnamed protein product [Phytomonas sp. EM1]|eukprot:CCW64135.1 unnamed protein product [Phytomonas sp. isolate EM1]
MSSFEDRQSKLLYSDDEEDQRQHSFNENTMPDNSTYYMRLGVSKDATQHEIRRAFLKLSQHYHTDMYMMHSEAVKNAMNTRFLELQEAYSVLSDIKKRAAYDAVGTKGPDRLALVPESWASRNDVILYLRSLDREAELINTAKMLSATSNITINYSIAHLFWYLPSILPIRSSSYSTLPPPPPSDAVLMSNDASGDSKATTLHAQVPSSDTFAAAEVQKSTFASPPSFSPSKRISEDDSSEAKEISSTSEPIHAQMTAMEVEIDGEPQIVLIPSRELQNRLRGKLQSSTTDTAAMAPRSGDATRRLALQNISPMEALLLATFPRSMLFQHSFEHAVSPTLNFVFRTQGTAHGKVASLSVGASSVYKRSPVTTYTADLVTRMKGPKVLLRQERVLSPLWSLRSKLTLLDGVGLLQKLQLSLTRKLSSITELENTITWCLSENGFLRTSLFRVWEGTSQYLSMHVGLNTLSFAASMSSEVTFGGDAHAPGYPSAKGCVKYYVSSTVFSGETQMGFEVWYYHRLLKHYGLSFVTKIPYAPSPFAVSSFFVYNSQHMMTNQLSLLYKRGKHRISIPIVIMISPTISHSIMWFSVPLCLYRLGKLLYRPYFNAKTAKKLGQLRREHIAEIDLARERAIMEQQALAWKAMEISSLECNCDGLVIINAQYGILKPDYSASTCSARTGTSYVSRCLSLVEGIHEGIFRRGVLRVLSSLPFSRTPRPNSPVSPGAKGETATEASKAEAFQLDGTDPVGDDNIPRSLDVTIALQTLVRDSALLLPEGPKGTLVGFCDPDPYALEPKQLKIVYRFHGKKHLVVLDDSDPVELPQREHLCL